MEKEDNINIEDEGSSSIREHQEEGKKDILTVLKNEDTSKENIEDIYSDRDIITNEWISDNFPVLEKLFPLFQRAAFSRDDPRSYSELNDDEKRIFDALLYEELSIQKEIKEDGQEENQELKIFNGNNEIRINTIKDEINKLFGRGVSERRNNQFLRYKFDKPLDKETSTTVEISHSIYKKLVIIGLYYKKELYIKTADGKKLFTWPESAEESIDGLLYYKDHQEKYWGENRYKFISDNYGKPRETYIAIADVKISDLTYGSIQEAIGSLSKNEIAPTFSQTLSKALLPRLWTGKKDNDNIIDGK